MFLLTNRIFTENIQGQAGWARSSSRQEFLPMIRTASIMRPLPVSSIDDVRGVTQSGCGMTINPSGFTMQPFGTGHMQALAAADALDLRFA
jgi:hypothetical protein